MITIGLLWHSFRSGNLGVGALSVCNLTLIDEEVSKSGMRARYVIIGNSGELNYVPSEFSDRITFVHFSARNLLVSPIAIYKAIEGCDVVFDIGEGDSFSDIYGLPRLLKMSFSKAVSLAKGRTLVLSPQTIGPFKSAVGKIIAKSLMKRAKAVVARDFMSRKLMSEMNLSNASEAIDVAFFLPYVKKERIARSDGKVRVGVNVSALLYHGGYNGKNQFGLRCTYSDFTNKLLRHLSSQEMYEVHLVPHVLSLESPVEDDYEVSRALKEEYPSLVLPERFKSPGEAKSYIANLDVFVGARMHATIGAFSSGVPVLPLAYSRKFAGLFESIGYKRVLDMSKLSDEELLNGVLSGISELEKMRFEVEKGMAEARRRIVAYQTVISAALTLHARSS